MDKIKVLAKMLLLLIKIQLKEIQRLNEFMEYQRFNIKTFEEEIERRREEQLKNLLIRVKKNDTNTFLYLHEFLEEEEKERKKNEYFKKYYDFTK